MVPYIFQSDLLQHISIMTQLSLNIFSDFPVPTGCSLHFGLALLYFKSVSTYLHNFMSCHSVAHTLYVLQELWTTYTLPWVCHDLSHAHFCLLILLCPESRSPGLFLEKFCSSFRLAPTSLRCPLHYPLPSKFILFPIAFCSFH